MANLKWVTGSLQTKTTLLIVGIMTALLAAFIFYDVQSQKNTLEEVLLQKGTSMAQTGAASVSHVLEDAIATGRLTEAQVFDEDYKPIAGTNPQKYHTANDSFLDANILQIEDTYLKDADVLFAVAVDTNSYLPTHNTRYTKMLTGDYQTDLVGNRTKRLFNDPVGIAAAQNLQPILRQIYRRDTGEIAWDMSAPIYVKGKHWGGFRVGFSLAKIDAEVATAVWRIMLAALLLIGAIGVTAFLVARSITKPLVPVMTMIQEMGKGHLGMRLRTKRKDEIGILANTMDQFADDLQNTVVGTMKKIAAGDLSTNVNPRDTQDEISPALKATTESLRGLVSEANMLTKAAVEGKLATRGDAAKFQGSYRDIVQGVNDTLDAVIGPLNVAAEYVDRISKGDIPSKITDQYNGDFNGIRNNLNQCIDAVNALVADANMLSKAAIAGNLATRADAAKHQGDFRKIVQGVNDTLDAVIGPLNVAAEYVDRISKGDIPARITDKYNGDFNEIKNNLNQCIEAVNLMIADANKLSQAAIAGKLATRADTAKHQGDFHKIVQGVNDTLDAVIGPLNVAAEYVDRISKGDMPSKITDKYNGDFNEIKNNLNALIDTVNMRNQDMDLLIAGATAGNLAVRADARKYVGYNGKLIDEINRMLDTIVAPIHDTQHILGQIAQGDLTVKLNGHYQGDFAVLRDSIETLVRGLKGMAGQSQQSAVSMTSATAQILASSTQMASTTREQASAVNEVSSTVREIKASAEQVAQRAQSVAEQATRASEAAQRGTDAVGAAMRGMDDIRGKVEAIAENILALSEQTQQIGEIIDTVTDIAGQSNILALNAAIEAAQAGEAGKGFRVVADEVRSLAEQSRQAAAQVKTILGDIQRATNQAVMATEQGTKGVHAGSEQVNRTAQTIQELARVVDESAQAAQQIVAGVEQQTIGLDQIVIGMNDINQAAQQTSSGAQQSQKAAQDMNELAEQLKHVVAQYRM